jgi:hypothetical protein
MRNYWVRAIAPLMVLASCAAASGQLKAPEESSQPRIAQVTQYIDVMEKYLYVVDHLARLADNPAASGVAAVMNANELLKSKPQDAIDYFNRVLPDVKNESVRRAIRLQLADLYKKSDQPDKALEQMRELMVSAPASPRPAAPPRLPSLPRRESPERRPPPAPEPAPER